MRQISRWRNRWVSTKVLRARLTRTLITLLRQALSSNRTSLCNDVTDQKLNATNAALSLQETQKNIQSSLDSPLAIHYKGITITPGGFLAAETVWRQHGLG